MPTNRFQFSDDFVLNNGNVGINSATPQTKLDVVGVVRGDNLKVTGVSTFTTYEGFLNSNQNIVENTTISGGGISGSLSGEIIVGTGITVTVASGTTSSQGNIDSLKVYNTFTVPVGGTADRPPKPTPGQLFFNRDFATMEFWDGDRWRQVDNTTRSGRGLFAGGYKNTPGFVQTIDYVTISTNGNAVNFGDLPNTYAQMAGFSDSTRGLFFGGYKSGTGTSTNNEIHYVTMASTGNSIDFGDLNNTSNWGKGGASSSTRGLAFGGFGPSPRVAIDYVQIQTIGNALDFGDVGSGGYVRCGMSSPTRCLMGPSSSSASIQTVQFASKGTGVQFGNGNKAIESVGGSNSVRGIYYQKLGSSTLDKAFIHTVIISTFGDSINFGELQAPRTGSPWSIGNCGNVASSTRLLFAGGQTGSPAANDNRIDVVLFTTSGISQDFGDLSVARSGQGGCSDSHGGLGGF